MCHIYQWIARPTHGSVCNHCERMMDGYTLDDLIFGSGGCSLMEDEVLVCLFAEPTRHSRNGMIGPAHDLSHQFISHGQWFQS